MKQITGVASILFNCFSRIVNRFSKLELFGYLLSESVRIDRKKFNNSTNLHHYSLMKIVNYWRKTGYRLFFIGWVKWIWWFESKIMAKGIRNILLCVNETYSAYTMSFRSILLLLEVPCSFLHRRSSFLSN